MKLTPIEMQWAKVKIARAQFLESTDWVILRAQDQGTPVPDEWKVYRQGLRDITEQPDPFNIQWPVRPT